MGEKGRGEEASHFTFLLLSQPRLALSPPREETSALWADETAASSASSVARATRGDRGGREERLKGALCPWWHMTYLSCWKGEDMAFPAS